MMDGRPLALRQAAACVQRADIGEWDEAESGALALLALALEKGGE